MLIAGSSRALLCSTIPLTMSEGSLPFWSFNERKRVGACSATWHLYGTMKTPLHGRQRVVSSTGTCYIRLSGRSPSEERDFSWGTPAAESDPASPTASQVVGASYSVNSLNVRATAL